MDEGWEEQRRSKGVHERQEGQIRKDGQEARKDERDDGMKKEMKGDN